jgi:dTMP kinase
VRRLLQHDAGGEGMAAETELFLFMASRAQLVCQVIAPALADGVCVVCDRFADSTTAYQGYARGCDVEKIIALNDWATGGLAPDLTILLDLDVTAGFERLRRRNLRHGAEKDRIERETLGFHERVRAGYLELARRWPQRIRVVDAARDEDAVQADIWELAQHVIGT